MRCHGEVYQVLSAMICLRSSQLSKRLLGSCYNLRAVLVSNRHRFKSTNGISLTATQKKQVILMLLILGHISCIACSDNGEFITTSSPSLCINYSKNYPKLHQVEVIRVVNSILNPLLV